MGERESGGLEDAVGSITDAASLGFPLLVQIVEGMADGILICDEDRRCVYVNPAVCRMLGRPALDLLGYGYEQVIPPRDLVAAREYFAAVLEGSTELVTQMLVGADGEEREFVHASFRVSIHGRTHGAALIRDFTESRTARRSASALAQSAAELVGDVPTNEILSGIARHAVEGTRATWAGIAVIGESGGPAFAGAYGPGDADLGDSDEARPSSPATSTLEAMTAGAVRAGKTPSRPVTVARRTWEEHPFLSTYADTILQHDWQFAVCVPLAYDNRVTGALMVLLPSSTTALDDAEVTFCTALADYAAVAAATEHLAARAARSAELRERGRVARELHDSVSQALFAMTMHARSARLVLARTGRETDTPLARSLEQLSRLSRSTLAEMRALIFELRPESLAEEGLARALTTQAAAISVREDVTITVDGPVGRLPLGPELEAEVYQMVSEILREEVRRSSAQSVAVTLSLEEQDLTITIVGDRDLVRSTAGRDGPDASEGRQSTVTIVVPLPGPRRVEVDL